LWWTWEAPGYGSAVIRKRGTSEPPVVGIYTRRGLQTLELMASSATEFGNECYRYSSAHDSVEWDTVPGGHYEIQIDRFPQFVASTPAEMELVFTPAPPNDTAAGAIAIEGVEASLTVSNTNATLRPGELVIPTQSGSNSVWFKWTSPSRGVLQVTRFDPTHYQDPSYDLGSTITFPLPRCSGDFTDLHPLPPFVPVFGLLEQQYALPGQAPGPTTFLTYGPNSLTSDVSAGRDYWIELDGDQASSGETPLNLLLIPTPVNDDFTHRIALPSDRVRVTGRTFAATREATDPYYIQNDHLLERSVWWEWRAPSTGRWTLFVVKGASENKFVVYRGDVATPGSEIKTTEREPMIFDCQSAEAMQIGVFALAGFGGNIEFTLMPVETPALRVQAMQDYWWGERLLTLQLPDNSGLPYVVDRSDDLRTWIPVTTNANAWSHLLEIHTEVGKPLEFFRTRLPDEVVP
jgi:hypothetical protein